MGAEPLKALAQLCGVKKILSLSIYPDLDKEKVDYVCATVRDFFRRG